MGIHKALPEPLARSLASGRSFWKPEEKGSLYRESYPFEIPVNRRYAYGLRPAGWMMVRVVVEVVPGYVPEYGHGYRYRLNVVILDQDRMTPHSILYLIHSKDYWRDKYLCAQRGRAAGRTIYFQLRVSGVREGHVKKLKKMWFNRGEINAKQEQENKR